MDPASFGAIAAEGGDEASLRARIQIRRHGPEGWREHRAWQLAEQTLADSFIAPTKPDLSALAAKIVSLGREDISVEAVKKAENNAGVIVRL